MMSFKEFLQESFEIKAPPKRIGKSKQKEILIRYLTPEYKEESDEMADIMFRKMKNLQIFETTTNGVDYILFLHEIDDYYVIDFNDIDMPNFIKQTDKHETPPMGLFGEMFNILYHTCLLKGLNIRIEAPEKQEKKINFYYNMIKNVIDKHELEYDVDRENNFIYITNKTQEKSNNTNKFYRMALEEGSITKPKWDGETDLVSWGINLRNKNLTSLPFDYSSFDLDGSFDCSKNSIVSLIGSPKSCEDFDCTRNELVNLIGSPEKVNGHFLCYSVGLESLKGLPKYIGRDLDCANVALFEVSPILNCKIMGDIDIGRKDINVILNKYKNNPRNLIKMLAELKKIDKRYC